MESDYNRWRRHSACGRLCPEQFENQTLAQIRVHITWVRSLCRKLGISDARFYAWRKKYGGISPTELKHMRQLEEENLRLKRLVADLSLDKVCCSTCWIKELTQPRLLEWIRDLKAR